MANIDFKAADATTKYQKATGAGTNLDPFIVEHLETNSAALKTALEIIDNFISGARGLVTEDNSAAIKTAVEIIDNIVAGTEAQVDVITSALPTGAATAANQSTANTALAAIQTAAEIIDNFISGARGLVTEDNSSAIKTAVEILDNIVSGSEAQVDVLTQPARDRLTDNVGAALQTDIILNDTTALTPKFAVIDAATSGDNTLIAAVAGKKIRVLAGLLVAAGTVTVRFESGAAGTALTGQMSLVANTGFQIPFVPVGNFETAVTTLLNLELSAAISVDGWLVYVEV